MTDEFHAKLSIRFILYFRTLDVVENTFFWTRRLANSRLLLLVNSLRDCLMARCSWNVLEYRTRVETKHETKRIVTRWPLKCCGVDHEWLLSYKHAKSTHISMIVANLFLRVCWRYMSLVTLSLLRRRFCDLVFCPYICVYPSVNKITQKVVDGSRWNFPANNLRNWDEVFKYWTEFTSRP